MKNVITLCFFRAETWEARVNERRRLIVFEIEMFGKHSRRGADRLRGWILLAKTALVLQTEGGNGKIRFEKKGVYESRSSSAKTQ